MSDGVARTRALLGIGADYGSTPIHIAVDAQNITFADVITDTDGNYIDYNGSDEFLSNDTAQDVSFSTTFSICVWVNPDAVDSTQRIIAIEGAGNASTVFLHIWSPAKLSANFRTAAAAVIKNYAWAGMAAGEWQHWVITWDGTTFTGYRNGAEVTPSDIFVDGTGDAGGSDRTITIGAQANDTLHFAGGIGGVGVWDKGLTAAEVTAIYASGDRTFDPRTNSGDYTSAANLVHLWDVGNGRAVTVKSANGIIVNGVNVSALNTVAHIQLEDADGTTYVDIEAPANSAVPINISWLADNGLVIDSPEYDLADVTVFHSNPQGSV